MFLVRFPIDHYTLNYDRVVLTSINVERTHDFISWDKTKYHFTYEGDFIC